jgi:hypothetical protein
MVEPDADTVRAPINLDTIERDNFQIMFALWANHFSAPAVAR